MGKIRLSVTSHAPAEKVFTVVREVHDFVDLLPNIKAIHVINESKDRNYFKAEWILDLRLPVPHVKLSWLQEIFWDTEAKSCRFRLSPDNVGIVKCVDGTMLFKAVPKGTEMIMDMDFRVEHPLVTPMVQRIFDGIMRKNNKALLLGIKKKAESIKDERKKFN